DALLDEMGFATNRRRMLLICAGSRSGAEVALVLLGTADTHLPGLLLTLEMDEIVDGF
ncbi:hypothetical protein ACLOJK_018849, partial [Asimina triloba]